MFLKLNNSPKHNSLRSRPPAGQHQQKGKSSFSKINKVNVNKVNVKVNVNTNTHTFHTHVLYPASIWRCAQSPRVVQIW